jgi:hypothetical protein
MQFLEDLGTRKAVIGLVHLKPLPGTPLYRENGLEEALEKALKDGTALHRGGADGCLIQTVDRIYPSGDDSDYARVSAMAMITHEVKKATGPEFKVGVQLMWNCITPSLAVAKVCGGSFVRCTALIGTTTSPFGIIDADPLSVQNYRKMIGAQDISMVAEIEGYHFHWLGEERSIEQKARMAMMAGADAVEVLHLDEETNNRMVHDIKAFDPSIPVILGGKTDLENVARRMEKADGAFVGSCFENRDWGGYVDESIVREYVDIVRSL